MGGGLFVEGKGGEPPGAASLELLAVFSVRWVSAGCIAASSGAINDKVRSRGGREQFIEKKRIVEASTRLDQT